MTRRSERGASLGAAVASTSKPVALGEAGGWIGPVEGDVRRAPPMPVREKGRFQEAKVAEQNAKIVRRLLETQFRLRWRQRHELEPSQFEVEYAKSEARGIAELLVRELESEGSELVKAISARGIGWGPLRTVLELRRSDVLGMGIEGEDAFFGALHSDEQGRCVEVVERSIKQEESLAAAARDGSGAGALDKAGSAVCSAALQAATKMASELAMEFGLHNMRQRRRRIAEGMAPAKIRHGAHAVYLGDVGEHLEMGPPNNEMGHHHHDLNGLGGAGGLGAGFTFPSMLSMHDLGMPSIPRSPLRGPPPVPPKKAAAAAAALTSGRAGVETEPGDSLAPPRKGQNGTRGARGASGGEIPGGGRRDGGKAGTRKEKSAAVSKATTKSADKVPKKEKPPKLDKDGKPKPKRAVVMLPQLSAEAMTREGKHGLTLAAIQAMNQKELQHKFEEVYGKKTGSNNNNWLRKKLAEAAMLVEPRHPSSRGRPCVHLSESALAAHTVDTTKREKGKRRRSPPESAGGEPGRESGGGFAASDGPSPAKRTSKSSALFAR